MSQKRPGSMSDADRALQRRTAGRGVPIAVDPELTPPPQEPPAPSSLRGFDSIPPPIQEQLEVLATGLGQATHAIGKLWDVRKDAARLDAIDAKLGTLATHATKHETMLDDFVMPAIKELMGDVGKISSQLPLVMQQLEMTSKLLSAVDERLRKLEVDMRVAGERHESSTREIEERLDGHDHSLGLQDRRIDKLEKNEAVSKALTKRERRQVGGIGAVVATVVSAIAAAIAHFTK